MFRIFSYIEAGRCEELLTVDRLINAVWLVEAEEMPWRIYREGSLVMAGSGQASVES